MKAPVVFLDFDGVIHDMGRSEFMPRAVQALNHLLRETGAAVVVSSMWRRKFSLAELREVLSLAGVVGAVVDVTPVLQREIGGMFVSSPRCNEIADWLWKNGIPPHLVLDDDTGANPDILTDPHHGLTMEQAERGVRLLRARMAGTY